MISIQSYDRTACRVEADGTDLVITGNVLDYPANSLCEIGIPSLWILLRPARFGMPRLVGHRAGFPNRLARLTIEAARANRLGAAIDSNYDSSTRSHKDGEARGKEKE